MKMTIHRRYSMKNFDNAIYIKAEKYPSEFTLYDPIPFFRKEFEISDEVKDAQIFVQSPGFACFYINGQIITEDIFISPLSDYRKILWYNTYDVTTMLKPGKNVIGVICSNGFFNESFESGWHYPTAEWRDAPQFLLCLKVNGSTAVVSNETWTCSKEESHIIYSHLRSGESYIAIRAT